MNWGVGDFQFLKSGSDEPCIQPIESSQLAESQAGWRALMAPGPRRKAADAGSTEYCRVSQLA
ncbi:hypothetical protein [Bordetella pertussis]|uniref:hypothetical protein n=1 Tax=Bordetella pertussis TaxID=520 RepID=UPI00031401C9|nr:hypothetical protein [Bordetella pertussis]QSY79383.1 hypothetical protein J3Q24_05605 [Bordetella pertussis]UEB57493.1 hypothetical protein LK428_15415 [Bordetella pertussis]ULZ02923.1 hypothetical protein HRJ82_03990 [Bordetella pertussis]ULZ33336.1 hypothetical protein HRJ75_15610 [Bordetella pertussis]UMA31996.1 hypothetical protein HRJ57_15700 [Bordetella pertussis]